MNRKETDHGEERDGGNGFRSGKSSGKLMCKKEGIFSGVPWCAAADLLLHQRGKKK